MSVRESLEVSIAHMLIVVLSKRKFCMLDTTRYA